MCNKTSPGTTTGISQKSPSNSTEQEQVTEPSAELKTQDPLFTHGFATTQGSGTKSKKES